LPGRQSEPKQFLDSINRANAWPMDDEPWGFAESIHGRDLTPAARKMTPMESLSDWLRLPIAPHQGAGLAKVHAGVLHHRPGH